MSRGKRYSPEQIIVLLRQAEVELGQGLTVGQVVQKLGVAEQTYYRWKNQYGGLKGDDAKRLRELEAENARLKKIVANQALDLQMLKEVAKGNW